MYWVVIQSAKEKAVVYLFRLRQNWSNRLKRAFWERISTNYQIFKMTTTTKNTGSKKMRSICFTLNNYTDGDLVAIQASDLYKYGIVGKEVGESGTPHLQGYLQLKKQTRAKATQKALSALCAGTPWLVPAKGDAKANRIYCSKDGDFVEWGEATTKGKRMDLVAMKDAIYDGADWETLANEHTSAHARYHKWGEDLRKCIRTRLAKEALKASMETMTLRDWQQRALERLATQNDRKVLWIMDSTGGKGKTFLAKWLCVMQDAFYVEGGKKADISYAYDFQSTVVFDLSRQTQDFVNYGTIESFKNGMMFSAKYESTMKVFTPAKVIVFSNWAPDKSQLSADRWDIIDLEQQTVFERARTMPAITNEFIFTDDCLK